MAEFPIVGIGSSAGGLEPLQKLFSALPDTTGGPMLRPIERSEDLLRLDRQGGLARLAEDTGGFLVRDTNDLGSAFRRIEEDNRFHYMLTYSPSNENFDGKFRTINVKVKRDGAQVFARKGYFAVRSTAAPRNTVGLKVSPASVDFRSPWSVPRKTVGSTWG